MRKPGFSARFRRDLRLQGEVVFDDVDFGYNDDKIVLHNIEMYAKPGQKIAFVG